MLSTYEKPQLPLVFNLLLWNEVPKSIECHINIDMYIFLVEIISKIDTIFPELLNIVKII